MADACASEAMLMVPTIATRATSINDVVLFMLFGKREYLYLCIMNKEKNEKKL
jgi:hypothetical protein